MRACVCDGTVHGKPYEYCSRVALKRAARRGSTSAASRCTPASSPSSCCSSARRRRQLGPFDATDTLDKPCYDYKGLARSSEFLDDSSPRCARVGIDVYQIDHEDANGQFEVNFTYADALTTADNFTLRKMAASEIARKHGHDRHLHAQAVLEPHRHRRALPHLDRRREEQEPVPRRQGQARAGLVEAGLPVPRRAARACARAHRACAPTVNSYKRLVVGRALSGATWAPAYITYGDNNRTAWCASRAGGSSCGCRTAGCNPVSRDGRIIAAGLDGVERKLDPGEPNNMNLYELTPEQVGEQRHRHAAAEPERGDRRARAGRGGARRGSATNLAQEFIKLKRMEWIEYSRHVSDWETQRYLEFF